MIRYHSLSPAAYRDSRFAHIKGVESTEPKAYLDSIGIPTMELTRFRGHLMILRGGVWK